LRRTRRTTGRLRVEAAAAPGDGCMSGPSWQAGGMLQHLRGAQRTIPAGDSRRGRHQPAAAGSGWPIRPRTIEARHRASAVPDPVEAISRFGAFKRASSPTATISRRVRPPDGDAPAAAAAPPVLRTGVTGPRGSEGYVAAILDMERAGSAWTRLVSVRGCHRVSGPDEPAVREELADGTGPAGVLWRAPARCHMNRT
jgi:hypothetical protein